MMIAINKLACEVLGAHNNSSYAVWAAATAYGDRRRVNVAPRHLKKRRHSPDPTYQYASERNVTIFLQASAITTEATGDVAFASHTRCMSVLIQSIPLV